MNIFFLHLNTKTCAQMHVDKHVIKMIIETCQLLCSVHHISGSTYSPPYKLTHKNHPSSLWVRESIDNYNWLCLLGMELCYEYTYRYGKIHKCQEYILELKENIPSIQSNGFTSPILAMPDMYKSSNAVESYRAYYFFEKQHLFSWKGKINGRNKPTWIVETEELFQN